MIAWTLLSFVTNYAGTTIQWSSVSEDSSDVWIMMICNILYKLYISDSNSSSLIILTKNFYQGCYEQQ